MSHIKKFEAFIIPKPFRKKIWKDEDIALKILEDLETNGAPDLLINKTLTDEEKYTFTVNNFSVTLDFSEFHSPSAARTLLIYRLYIDGVGLDVSDEVCKKIKKVLDKIEKEPEEFIKKRL